MANNQISEALPFDYVVVTGAIAAAGSSQQTLTLAPDSEFELHIWEGRSSLDAVGNFRPNNFSVQITLQSTGRQLSNLRVPQSLMVSTAEFGQQMRRPFKLSRNSVLLFDFLNLDASNVNTITMTMRGYKLF